MKILLSVLMIAFTFSLDAQLIGRAGDCSCYEEPVMASEGTTEIELSPETVTYEVIPPQFEEVRDSILVSPATTGLDPRQPNCCNCIVEIPAVWKYFNRRKLVKGAQVIQTIQPAKTENVETFYEAEPGRWMITSQGQCKSGK